jgi:hypothetical protein
MSQTLIAFVISTPPQYLYMMSAFQAPTPTSTSASSASSSSQTIRSVKLPTLPIYSFDWSPNSSHFCSLAVGSFVTQPSRTGNDIQFIGLTDPHASDFQTVSPPITVEYPSTKVRYSPIRVNFHLHLIL